ncbi:MAG: hypothetical protein MI861_19860 [Pirellulales bacterium]|nr:hypothetical protein [Pirellulales bacterium]
MALMMLSALLVVTAAGDEEKIHPIAAAIQGDWEMNTVVNGDSMRIAKQIQGNTETVSFYRNGQLLQRHQVQFEVRDEGPVSVFRWSKGKHIAGARNGQPLSDGAAIIRIVNQEWISIEGMLKGDPERIAIQRFRRPK